MGNSYIGGVSQSVQDGQLGSRSGAVGGLLAVMGCASKGAYLTPTLLSRGAAAVSTFGYGELPEFLSAYIEDTDLAAYGMRLEAGSAATKSGLDVDGVTGTSSITYNASCAPLDTYQLTLQFTTGGDVGTAGIVYRYSLDGEQTWSAKTPLGTATTITISNTGLSFDLGVGTIVADDEIKCTTEGPHWDSADFSSAFGEFAKLTSGPILVLVLGKATKSEADAFETAINSYASSNNRYCQGLIAVRIPYDPARVTGDPQITFADNDPAADTIERDAGSFSDDGFQDGMHVTVANSTSNNGVDVYQIAASGVSALALTLVTGDAVSAEVVASGCEVTGNERFAAYQASVRGTHDDFAAQRVGCGAAAVRCASEIGAKRWKYRRPPSWAVATRAMQFETQESTAKVANGPLPARYTITDDNGKLIEHDSRIEAGLASLEGDNGRFITCQTWDGFSGVYIAVPSLMHDAGSDFTRLHHGMVMDVAQRIAQIALTQELSRELVLKSNGYIAETEAQTIEGAVNGRLYREMVKPGMVSDAYVTLARDDDLLGGNTVTVTVSVVRLGYSEKFSVTLSFVREEG